MVAHKFDELIQALEAEQKRRKGEKSAGKPKRVPPTKKALSEPKAQAEPKAEPKAKAELKKVPALKKAGKKETEMV